MLKDPSAKAIMNVDKFIGSDYEYVNSISFRLDSLKNLNKNLKELLTLNENIEELRKVFDKNLDYIKLNNVKDKPLPDYKKKFNDRWYYPQGTSFNVVQQTAINLDKLKRVEYYIPELLTIENNLDWLIALVKLIKLN